MISKVLFREYSATGNRISGVAGSKNVAGDSDCRFTDLTPGTKIELDDGRFVGIIDVITDDTHLLLKKKCEMDFTNEVWWTDWTLWRISSSSINKRIESANEGEGGAIVFDDVDMNFHNAEAIHLPDTVNYAAGNYDNPVRTVFAQSLDDRKKFLLRLQGLAFDWIDRDLITDDYKLLKTNTGKILYASYRGFLPITTFEGIVDFKTIKTPSYNDGAGEFSFEKSFTVMDKLSALNTLTAVNSRPPKGLKTRILYYYPTATLIHGFWDSETDLYISLQNFGGTRLKIEDVLLNAGEYIQVAKDDNGNPVYAVITNSETDALYLGDNGYIHLKVLANLTEYNTFNWSLDDDGGDEGQYLQLNYYSIEDIGIYASDVLTTFDGLKILQGIVSQAWGLVPVLNKMTDISGTAMNTFPLPLSYWDQLHDAFPFGQEPLDGLKWLASTMRAYIWFDQSGNFVIQNKYSLSTWAGPVRTIDLPGLTKFERSEFWDKLTDCVDVNVSSWIPDPDNTGEYLDGAGHWFKVIGMKARNPITRNILLDSLTLSRYGFTLNNCGTLSYPGLSTQTDMLNKYADLFATEEGEFYGKRHAMYDAELAGLTEDFLRWGMLDIIQYDGTNYFLQNVNADTDEDQGAFTMVEIEGHDYNLGNVIIGQARDTYIVP